MTLGKTHETFRQFSSRRFSFKRSSTNNLSPTDILRKERDAARCETTEHKEKLDAVFRAFELTSRIAAMDSTAYYRSQIGRDAGPTDHTKGRSRRGDSVTTDGHYESGTKLDAMLVEWKFEQTPLANLVSSVHRLQSNLFHTHNEAETTIDQTQTLHEDVTRYRERNRKLEKAIRLLSKDNGVLRVELEKTQVELEESKVENYKLVRMVQNHEEERKVKELDEAESRMSAQVEEHEKIMRDKMRMDEPKSPPPSPVVVAADLLDGYWGGRKNLSRGWGRSDPALLVGNGSEEDRVTSRGVAIVEEDGDAGPQSLVAVGGTATLHFHPQFPTPKITKKKIKKKLPMVDLLFDDKVTNVGNPVTKSKAFIEVFDFINKKNLKNNKKNLKKDKKNLRLPVS